MLFTNLGDYIDLMIRENGIAIVPTVEGCHYLHTIGNTDHRCPELLVFFTPGYNTRYHQLLTQLSSKMRDTGEIPKLHTRYCVDGLRFSCIEMELVFAAHFAEAAIVYYHHTPIRVLQLLTPDQNNKYPFDLGYDCRNGSQQPICRTN